MEDNKIMDDPSFGTTIRETIDTFKNWRGGNYEMNILDKLNNSTIKQIKLFKANVDTLLAKKIEEKKMKEYRKEYQEKIEKECFFDPRDNEMMSEIYPEG